MVFNLITVFSIEWFSKAEQTFLLIFSRLIKLSFEEREN